MLTDVQCRAAEPRAKPYKLADGKGLHLYISPTGHKSFRWKYRFGGKEKQLVFGPYPEVKLAEARGKRDQAAATLRNGQDPGAVRKSARAPGDPERSFESIGRRWHADQSTRWKPHHAADVLSSLTKEVFPAIGAKDIAAIDPLTVLETVEAVQKRGAIETAHRVLGRIEAIFDMAIARSLIRINPAAGVGRALKPVPKGRRPALTKLAQARDFLARVEAMSAQPSVKLASRLLALTAVRPGVIRSTPIDGEFEQLDGKEPLWRIPPERMKLGLEDSTDEAFEHLVPLTPQAVETIAAARLAAGRSDWLFPNTRSTRRQITLTTLSSLYLREEKYGGRHVPHGWRSTFSSVMNELAVDNDRPGDADVIELMLAHKAKGVRGIYNRAAYMKRRREIAQEWADMLLEGFAPAAELIDGRRRG